MQDKLPSVIIAAYTPEEYKKILSISEDIDKIDKNWVQWRQTANEKKSESAMQDVEYVEQFIDAEGLLKYCLGEGVPVDARARANYANLLYEKQRRESIVSPNKSEEEERLTTRTHSYTPPVDQLLAYTSIKGEDPLPEEISYVEKFGIGPEHIPELICMATDDYLASDNANEFEFTAPIHAICTLAELRAEAAIEPLVILYDKVLKNSNQWMLDALVDFYTDFGLVGLPVLEQFLADQSHEKRAQHFVRDTIEVLAKKKPEARPECIAAMTRRLAEFEVNDPVFNGFLIADLVDLKAVESVPLIQRALASGCVDKSICGDWNEVQYDLGLKERPEIEPDLRIPATSTPTQPMAGTANTLAHKPTKKSSSSKKAKTKMIKASKRANRRKK